MRAMAAILWLLACSACGDGLAPSVDPCVQLDGSPCALVADAGAQ